MKFLTDCVPADKRLPLTITPTPTDALLVSDGRPVRDIYLPSELIPPSSSIYTLSITHLISALYIFSRISRKRKRNTRNNFPL